MEPKEMFDSLIEKYHIPEEYIDTVFDQAKMVGFTLWSIENVLIIITRVQDTGILKILLVDYGEGDN